MKKFISLLTCFVLVFSVFCIEFPQNTASAAKKTADFELDFNDCKVTGHIYDQFSSYGTRWIFPQTVDKAHGVSMAMKSSSSVSAYKSFDAPLQSGAYYLSFDIRQTSTTTNTAQVRFSGGGKTYRSFIANTSGYMGLSRFTNGSTLDHKISYSANRWYRVNMWIDFFDRTIYYYIDNEFVGKTHLDLDMPSISSIGFFLSATDPNELTYWDNIRLAEVNEALITEMREKKIPIPEKVESPLNCTFSSDVVGNNFSQDQEIALTLGYTGRILNGEPYKVTYEVYGSNGKLNWRGEDSITLNEDETLQRILKPQVEFFDIYTLKVIVHHGDKKYTFTKEFSKVNTPSPEFSSHKFGSSGGHMMNMNRSHPDNVLPLFDMSGMGIIREGISWGEFERKKGVYGLSDKMKERFERILAFTEEKDIYMTLNVSGTNSLYPNPSGTSKLVTVTPEGLDALEKFACNLAEIYPEVDAYLFQNEPDARAIYQMSCEEYANALKRFYTGIKKGNPNAKVWGCNTMRANTPWVEGVIMAGGGDYMDGVTIHPYQGQGSGETTRWVEYVSLTRQMLDSYGYEHLTICASEANTSSSFDYNSEIQQGFNLIRQWSLMDAYPDMLDSYITYTFATFDDATDNESQFGITRGWNVDNTAGAKPAYLAVSNFLAQIEDKTFEKLLHDDDIYVYHYKDEKGEDMLMMYSDVTTQQISLKMDASKGELYDWYGNKTDINAIDGTYTFIIDDLPRYFRGNFTDVEFTEGKISIDSPLTEITVGSHATVNLSVENSDAYTYEVTGSDSLSASLTKTENGAAVILGVNYIPEKFDFTAQRSDYSTLDRRDYVFVNVKKGGKLYARLPLGVEYVEKPVDVTMTFKPYDSRTTEHYSGVIEIQNNQHQRSASGKIVFDSPKALADSVGELQFKNINPRSSDTLTFAIPDSLVATWFTASGRVILSNGEEVSFIATGHPRSYYKEPGSMRIGSLHRKNADIKIDGVMDENEWKEYKLVDFDKSEVTFGADLSIVDAGVITTQTFTEDADYGTGNDFSGTLYATWDNEFLYMAAKVRDDVHFNKEGPVKLRTGDSAYWAICPTLSQRHDSTFLFGLSDFYGQFEPLLFNTWTNVPDQRYSYLFGGREGEDESEFNIIREGEYTTYEAKVPWEYALPEFTGLNQNFSMSFSVRDFDGDRDKSFSFSRWFVLTQ